MNIFTIVGLVAIFAINLLVSHFYLKDRLKITNKRTGLLSKAKKRYSMVIEIVIICLFVLGIGSMIERNFGNLTVFLTILPMLGMFFLISVNQGLEEWFFYRDEKVYYYKWLETIFILLAFLIVLIGEQL